MTTLRPMTLPAIWNMSFGFLGIQIGFALQNANMSRIFQSLGEDIEKLPGLWVAAPLTGLLTDALASSQFAIAGKLTGHDAIVVRGRADALAVLVTHMTTGPKIILDDEEENHQIVKSKDEAEINNLARYILSR